MYLRALAGAGWDGLQVEHPDDVDNILNIAELLPWLMTPSCSKNTFQLETRE
jgi:hypothetical protein